MIPDILQQLGRNQVNPIKQMMNMVKMSQNPQAMIQQMMMQNPKMQEVMQIVKQHGGDPMKAFYAEAEKRGMDPDEILGMLK